MFFIAAFILKRRGRRGEKIRSKEKRKYGERAPVKLLPAGPAATGAGEGLRQLPAQRGRELSAGRHMFDSAVRFLLPFRGRGLQNGLFELYFNAEARRSEAVLIGMS